MIREVVVDSPPWSDTGSRRSRASALSRLSEVFSLLENCWETELSAGTVTSVHDKGSYGMISGDIFFTFSVVVGGRRPRAGDKVIAECKPVPSMPFKLNATRVRLLPDDFSFSHNPQQEHQCPQKPTTEAAAYHQEEDKTRKEAYHQEDQEDKRKEAAGSPTPDQVMKNIEKKTKLVVGVVQEEDVIYVGSFRSLFRPLLPLTPKQQL